MDVGLELKVKRSKLDCIDANHIKVERKALQMLFEWKDQNLSPCYCELLAALTEKDLHQVVKCLKEFIFSKRP